MKTTLKIESGRIRKQYPGQTSAQPVVADISADGEVYVHYNPEIGNAVPMDIGHGIRRRITLPVTTKAQARAWYQLNKTDLEALVAGMGERWDGNNTVGTLTEDARAALDALEYDVYANADEYNR